MIDFHAHLDLYPDPAYIVQEIISRKMYVLSMTTTPSAWNGTSSLAHQDSHIRTALGLHPQLAHQRLGELPLFDQYIGQTEYVGEIGLDGARDFKQFWEPQLQVFEHILGICGQSGGKIMSIHSRRATSAVLDCLNNNADAGIPILHWFTGNKTELKRAIHMGCWFSVGPAMLKSKNSKALVAQIPKDRILTESDGPFVQIHGKSAMPWDVQIAVSNLAHIWQVEEAAVDMILRENLKKLVTLTSNVT